MVLETRSPTALMQGYQQEEDGAYRCLHCTATFTPGEVYPLDGRFFEAHRAVKLHLEAEHPDHLQRLIGLQSKYNTLTDNQANLLELFAAGFSDKEIAARLGVTVSTVRHQKFSFREKAKQARLYLAQYGMVFEQPAAKSGEGIIPVHTGAKQVDDRYVTTEEERDHILSTSFVSLSPLKLGAFSPKEKKKVVILGHIARELEQGRRYTEPELNAVLKEIFPDFATLRRYLIQYGFMEREKDGSAYWLT